MSTWKERCAADGGFATVMPTQAGDMQGTPACRFPLGGVHDDGGPNVGAFVYVDYRDTMEVLADQAAVVHDNTQIAVGDVITGRDTFVGAIEDIAGKVGTGVQSILTGTVTTLALVAALGFGLYLAVTRRGAR